METLFPSRKLSQSCDLFEYKKNNSHLTPNEDLLKLYMNDLNKIYNQSFNSSAIIEILQHSGQSSHLQPNRFKLCKEKAFDFLQKSEQINSYLESMAFGADSRYISQEEIKKMVDNQHFEAQSEFSNLVNLYKKFEVDFSELKSEKLDNFIGSGFIELKALINQTVDFLANSQSTSGEDFCFKNLMIYGPPGSGIRSVMDTILRTKLNNTLNQQKNCECYVKILRVNFGTFGEQLVRTKGSDDLFFIENLISSINLYKIKHRVNVFLILENVEHLFEQEMLKTFRVRFLGDMLYELGIQDKTADNIQSSRLFFAILSERPWSLPSALIQQFGKKIFCGLTSEQDARVICKQALKNMDKKLKKNWLFENFADFSKRENLVELISSVSAPFVLTEKLLRELFAPLETFLLNILEEMLNVVMNKELINSDALTVYRKQTERSSWFKEKTSIRFVPKLSLRKYSLANRKKTSLAQLRRNENFENLKNDMWNSKSNAIRKKIAEFCLKYFENNQISHDLEKLYENFQEKYKNF
ncbi:hypothetical protein BpHYR1_004750 [Brachionus plicatilis]|uniref:Uncharacterized protein n=1 Tax=Brachionus plicatilis TaxID=10195 RepID=A0A3M7PN31_BRAPC|nr:hypothetical protein BpHYR1_004750 [Brachionus plicatilis]